MKWRWTAAIYIACLIASASTAQDIKYAKSVIADLTGPSFHGRGYVKDGDDKAAEYIYSVFKKLKLHGIKSSYYQEFSFPVNTFPGKMEVVVDNKKLIPGKDFIVHPASAGSESSFEVEIADSVSATELLNHDVNRCLVVDMGLYQSNREQVISLLKARKKGAVVLLEEKKLTWSVAGYQFAIPVIIVIKDRFPSGTTQVSFRITSDFIPANIAWNVFAFLKEPVAGDSLIVFSAHYDHLGRMGKKVFFPGANDNASGTAMLLNLAKHYSKMQVRPGYNVMFVAFAAEEAGLIGSKYFTENPLFDLKSIRCLINLDLMGTGEEGLMVVNATEFKEEFALLKSINAEKKYMETLGERGKARNSDHYYFSEMGIPSFFLYTMGGSKAYHDIYDKAGVISLARFREVFLLIRDFADTWLNY